MDPIKLRLRKAESEPAYCYRGVEIQAMDLLAVLERKPRGGAYLFHGPRGGHLMDRLGHTNSEMIRHY